MYVCNDKIMRDLIGNNTVNDEELRDVFNDEMMVGCKTFAKILECAKKKEKISHFQEACLQLMVRLISYNHWP